METLSTKRQTLLHKIVRQYVEEGLAQGNFDKIPYRDDVELRAPICPGGSAVPLRKKDQLREVWWTPLPDLVERCEVVDSYVNEARTAATVEFYCYLSDQKTKLRIVDRFKIDENGNITEQENFFDPRDVTNPGWQQAQ